MSDSTTNEVVGTNDGRDHAASENVRKCPVFSRGRFIPATQVPAGLSDAQLRAIWLLITGTSLAKIADEVGVAPRTLYRWRNECDVFRAELDRARRQHWEHAADRLRGMVGHALDVLAAEVVDEYDRSRVRAAAMILQAVNIRKLMSDERARSAE